MLLPANTVRGIAGTPVRSHSRPIPKLAHILFYFFCLSGCPSDRGLKTFSSMKLLNLCCYSNSMMLLVQKGHWWCAVCVVFLVVWVGGGK